jgi:WD40 repeat protein
LWDIASRKVTWYFEGAKPVRAGFVGPYVAVYIKETDSVPVDNSVLLFDWTTRKQARGWQRKGDLEDISRDGKTLATSRSGIFRIDLWDVETYENLATLTNVPITFMALSPDGKTLAVNAAGAREVLLCDATGARPRRLLQIATGKITAVEFSPDGSLLATGGTDQSLRLWDVARHREVARLRGNESYVNGLAFSPDGQTMLAASTAANNKVARKQVLLGNLTTEKATVLFAAGWSKPVFFTTNSQSLVTLGRDTNGWLALTSWNITDSTAQTTVPLFDHRFPEDPSTILPQLDSPFSEGSMAVTADRQVLAIGYSDGSVKLWNTTSGRIISVFPALPNHTAAHMVFSPNGKTLAGFYPQFQGEHLLVIWDVASRTEKVRLNLSWGQPNSLQFSPDNRLLAAGMADHVVHLWDASTGSEWANLVGHQGDLGSACFSPDGRTLASVSGDIKLWNLASQREVATCLEDRFSIRFCAFAEAGQSLVTVDWHGTVRLLRVPSLAQIEATEVGREDMLKY